MTAVTTTRASATCRPPRCIPAIQHRLPHQGPARAGSGFKRAAPAAGPGEVPFWGVPAGAAQFGWSREDSSTCRQTRRALLCPDHPSGPSRAHPRGRDHLRTRTPPMKPPRARLVPANDSSARISDVTPRFPAPRTSRKGQTWLSTILTVPPRQPLGPRSWAPSTQAPGCRQVGAGHDRYRLRLQPSVVIWRVSPPRLGKCPIWKNRSVSDSWLIQRRRPRSLEV